MQVDFAHVKDHYAARSHVAMQDVLMDPKADGPAIHYYMIRGSSHVGNITVWEPGTVGGEYVKTYGHYHVGKLEEEYEILSAFYFFLKLIFHIWSQSLNHIRSEIWKKFQIVYTRQWSSQSTIFYDISSLIEINIRMCF